MTSGSLLIIHLPCFTSDSLIPHKKQREEVKHHFLLKAPKWQRINTVISRTTGTPTHAAIEGVFIIIKTMEGKSIGAKSGNCKQLV